MSSHRRPIAVAAAIATAAALGATALVLPATAAVSAPAPAAAGTAAPWPIVKGTLDWGVKETFRTYVTTVAKGEITVADGATKNADGTFRFGAPTGQYTPSGAHIVTAAFKGSVTFKSTAHHFEITLSNPRFDTGAKKLVVDVKKNGTLTANVPFATVAFAGPQMEKLGTVLTAEAAEQLDYPGYKDQPGDALTAVLEFGKPPVDPKPSTSTDPEPTTSTDPKPTTSTEPRPTTSTKPSTSTKPPTKPPTRPSTSTGPKPSTSTGAPADGARQIQSGKLKWGVKESFRTYVQSAGSITPAGGAVASDGTFSFAGGKGTLDTSKGKLNASFEGNLRFRYAAHGIDMTFGNVRIDTQGAKGTLVLDVKTAAGTKTNVPFATLDLAKAEYKTSKGLLALNGVRTALTEQGAAAFLREPSTTPVHQDGYAPGDRIDDVNLTVSVDKDVTAPDATGGSTTGGSTSGGTGSTGGTGTGGGGTVGGGGSVGGGGNLASTGAEIPAGALLGASGAVIAAGAGAVLIARRRRMTQG
ncbi:HtaA domain-containing protein [Streptomyces sp. NBC_01426]|uniref:HtaA domain-containing protein n=1 Tax=Streptomyces sp. NBC_01426 TaxID=2975866 RepID=UPI002E3605F7|nr:HtaA domain-containing protein [Streptomyces sp. NBC_01426]